MSKADLEIVRQMYDAYARAEIERALAAFAPDVEFDASVRPEGGIYHGPAGIAEAMRTWSGTWENFKIEVLEIIDAGERIFVAEHQTGRGKGSGIPLDAHTFTVITIRDGLVAEMIWLAHAQRSDRSRRADGVTNIDTGVSARATSFPAQAGGRARCGAAHQSPKTGNTRWFER